MCLYNHCLYSWEVYTRTVLWYNNNYDVLTGGLMYVSRCIVDSKNPREWEIVKFDNSTPKDLYVTNPFSLSLSLPSLSPSLPFLCLLSFLFSSSRERLRTQQLLNMTQSSGVTSLSPPQIRRNVVFTTSTPANVAVSLSQLTSVPTRPHSPMSSKSLRTNYWSWERERERERHLHRPLAVSIR